MVDDFAARGRVFNQDDASTRATLGLIRLLTGEFDWPQMPTASVLDSTARSVGDAFSHGGFGTARRLSRVLFDASAHVRPFYSVAGRLSTRVPRYETTITGRHHFGSTPSTDRGADTLSRPSLIRFDPTGTRYSNIISCSPFGAPVEGRLVGGRRVDRQ